MAVAGCQYNLHLQRKFTSFLKSYLRNFSPLSMASIPGKFFIVCNTKCHWAHGQASSVGKRQHNFDRGKSQLRDPWNVQEEMCKHRHKGNQWGKLTWILRKALTNFHSRVRKTKLPLGGGQVFGQDWHKFHSVTSLVIWRWQYFVWLVSANDTKIFWVMGKLLRLFQNKCVGNMVADDIRMINISNVARESNLNYAYATVNSQPRAKMN